MARHDDYDLLDGEGTGGGDRLIGALFILVGTVIFLGAFAVMFYATDKGLESRNMHTFLTTFGLALLIGLPVFAGGIWLFKRGMRAWKGEPAEE
jgi:hypothetical protein